MRHTKSQPIKWEMWGTWQAGSHTVNKIRDSSIKQFFYMDLLLTPSHYKNEMSLEFLKIVRSFISEREEVTRVSSYVSQILPSEIIFESPDTWIFNTHIQCQITNLYWCEIFSLKVTEASTKKKKNVSSTLYWEERS